MDGKKAAILCLLITLVAAHYDNDADFTPKRRSKRQTDPITKRQFTFTTVRAEPYFMTKSSASSYQGKVIPLSQCYGFIPDLIRELSDEIGFTYTFQLVGDGSYGRRIENSSKWTGMIGEVIDGKADIAAAPLTVTALREQFVNFIRPFENVGLTVLVQKRDFTGHSETFPIGFDIFRPLMPEVYGLVTLVTLITALLLWVMNRFNPYEWGGRYSMGLADREEAEHFNVRGSLWFVFTTLQWQGYDRAPRSLASKLISCFWFVFVTVTLITYTGSLMNHLYWASNVQGVHPFKPPFRDLEHLVSSGTYEYGSVKGGRTEYILKNMAMGPMYDVMRSYWAKNEDKDLFPKSMKDGLEKVRQGKYAFIVETPSANFEVGKLPCDLTTIGETMHPGSYAMAVSKEFQDIEHFHIAIMSLHESGEIQRLQTKWWKYNSACWNVTEAQENFMKTTYYNLANSPKRVGLDNFWGPLVLMAAGMVFGIIVAVIEVLYYKHRGRYHASNRPGGQQLTNKMDEDDGRI